MLELDHLSLNMRVQDVSAKVRQGKLISVIGPNGAGKSTLLSLISQLSVPTAGRALLDRKLVQEYERRELAKRISLMRQSNELTVRLSIRDLVGFGRFPYTGGRRLTAEDTAAVDAAIERLGLNDLADAFTDQVSGGERQRAFIAMTLAQNSDYLMLDEPLNNLDMKHAARIMRTLRDLVDTLGKTVLLVIHDINFAAAYSDEIIALRHGALVAHGTTEEIITEESLRKIYGIDIEVMRRPNGQLLCNYFCS